MKPTAERIEFLKDRRVEAEKGQPCSFTGICSESCLLHIAWSSNDYCPSQGQKCIDRIDEIMAEYNKEVSMSKFKIGDKVRVSVKGVEIDSETKGVYFSSQMAEMDGEIYTITNDIASAGTYLIGSWYFLPEWLELVEEDKPEKTTGLTLPEILRALADGKKVRCPSWGEWRFVYIDLTNGDMLDEDGLDFSDWDVLVGCSELYVEPEPKPEKVTEQKWLWVYISPAGDYALGFTFRTEEEAKEMYGDRLICKYGEPIEVERGR